MLSFDGLTPDAFLKRVDYLLDDPTGILRANASDLLAQFTPQQITQLVRKRLGERPQLIKHVGALIPVAGGTAAAFTLLPSTWTAGVMAAAVGHAVTCRSYDKRHREIERTLHALLIERPSITLNDKERGLIRGMAMLFAKGLIDAATWQSFAAHMTWADGKAQLGLPPDFSPCQEQAEAHAAFGDGVKSHLGPYQNVLGQAAAAIGRHRQTLGPDVEGFLSQGARWMTPSDIEQSPVLSFQPTPAALIVGHDVESGRPVYYSRTESLFTIGGPGTGKTECQVIPNLLSYRGSAFVLDVKGELWEKTAGWRAANCGPVYRFAPTDPDGRTHRYNPFDFISRDPEQAATDCEVMSFQVVTPTANHSDPYWENRGRDYLWAMAMAVALQAEPRARAMATLMRLLSVPLDLKASTQGFEDTDTARLIRGLEQLASHHNIPALAEHANAIRGGTGSQRLESVADNARRFLAIFSRSASLRAAMGKSDWHPSDLRTRPGTTVYLCLAGDDLETFAPIVRLILQQHANALLKDFTAKPGEPPITFFLDEFPQLKRMDAIMRMVDTGRGAGLRLWFFAQYLGQVRQAYDKQADGLINSCRLRSFLSPDAEAATFLKPYLGERTNIFSGEKTPLAETHDLLGHRFADRILALSSGPAQFAKQYAWATMADRIIPPPRVPKPPRSAP